MSSYCGGAAANWKKAQEEQKLQRETLKENLEKLKKGITPDGSTVGGDDGSDAK